MKTEIEVKFLDIDLDDMRRRLQSVGATLEQPMRLMRRALIEQPQHEAEHSFLRVRDQGDKVTLCFKRRSNDKGQAIDDTQEIEVEVSDFNDAVELLKQAGWPAKTYQENKRETWSLNGVEVVIDEWPWIPPQIEIEGSSEEMVREVAASLGREWSQANFGHIDHVYQKYYMFTPGFRGIIDLAEVRFEDPRPTQMEEKS